MGKPCNKDEIQVLQKIMEPIKLEQESWMMVYGTGNQRSAQEILKAMKFAQNRLGIDVSDPRQVYIAEKGENKFIEKVRSEVKKQIPRIVLIILNRN